MTAPLAIVLGGVDVTAKVDFQSIVMQLAGSQETGSCEFDIVDEGLTVTATAESTLTVTDVGSATVLFGGFTRSPRTVLTAVGRIIHITAYDYNGLLDRSIVVSDSRTAGESDHTRLVYLMGIYGTQFSSDYTQIATLNASLPAQKFIAITLRQAIERVLGQASYKASYYVDATGRLVTYDRTVVTAAPFDIRIGTPGMGELSPDDWTHDRDTDNLANAIYVVGATAAGSGWFTDVTSIATYGRRERFFNAPDSDTSAKASQVGLAVLGDQKDPVPRATFTTQSPNDGWRIGQSTTVTSTQDNLSGVSLRIAKVTTHYLNGNGDREYGIELGAPQATLSALLGATHGGGGGFPWHSPGGAGAWLPMVGGGTTAGTVSSGGGCGCPPWDYTVCTPLRESFTRTVASGFGTSEFTGAAWVTGTNGTQSSVNGTEGRMQPAGGGTVVTSQYINLGFTYPLHIRFLTKIVGAGSSGALEFWLGNYTIESGLTGTIGATSFTLDYTSGGSPALALDVRNVANGGGGSSGAITYPFSTTDIHDQYFWTEVVMTLTGFEIRAYLDGSSPGSYTAYTNHLGLDITLPILLEAYASSVNPATPDWRIGTIEVLCDNASPGQVIANEFVAVGDGVRSSWTLQRPYQRGSVRLEVDGHDQSVVETDPTTGVVSLTFTPIAGEVITAPEYRAA